MDVAVNGFTRASMNKIEAQHYEKYRRLLCKTALRLFPQAQSVEPSIDFDDVLAMMNEVYVKCVSGFDETKAGFTTYLTRACFNQFNRWMQARYREGSVVSRVSAEQLSAATSVDGEAGMDIYETCHDEQAESPEDMLDRRQQQIALILSMSPLARQVATLLIKQPPELLKFYASQALPVGRVNRGPLTIDVICQYLRMTRSQAVALRRELRELTGVDFTRLNADRFDAQPALA